MDQALFQFLTNACQKASYDSDTIRDLIRDGVKDFQEHGKREFISSERDVPVQVAWRNVNDDNMNISHGTMIIPGCV